MINIILCGGSGTRLWPLSRTMLPKQFVRLFNNRSLFQDSVLRNAPLCSQSMIVSNRDQYFLAVDQLD
jgi:mannose-1-phosphate guanylyltransferase